MTRPVGMTDSGGKSTESIDYDDPLYLHPSDNTIATIISFKLLGIENYRIWRSSMIRALKGRNKLGFADGTVVKPTNDDAKCLKWERANAVVCSWLLGSLCESIYAGHATTELASVVWNELYETYHKSDGSVVFNLHQRINFLTQSGLSVSDYYNKLDSLWKEFDGLTNLPECVCDAAACTTEGVEKMAVPKCAYALNVEADYMEIDVEPKAVDLRFRCNRCQRVILVHVNWMAEKKFTKTLMCKGCRQGLKMKDINCHRHECFKDYLAVFSVTGNWKIKPRYDDNHILWRTNVFGEWIEFNTFNGNWKMPLSPYRGLAPSPEKEEKEIEDSEDSPLSESSDDPDKIDAMTMKMKKFDSDPWQCSGSGEKSRDSDDEEELPQVVSLRLKVSQFFRLNKNN